MVDVTIEGDRAIFEIEGLDKLWSMRSRLSIPIAHITNVTSDPAQVNRWWPGIKVAGTNVPGVFAAGLYYRDGLVFWDVRHPESTIIVSLEHELYRKLVVEVAEPSVVMRQLATARQTPSG